MCPDLLNLSLKLRDSPIDYLSVNLKLRLSWTT
jgi:hypothetical protein